MSGAFERGVMLVIGTSSGIDAAGRSVLAFWQQ
jgi:hypothetical protein